MSIRRMTQSVGWIVLIGGVSVFLILASCGGEATPSPGAAETAEARRVLATLTAEAQTTPTPSAELEAVVQEAFEAWGKGQGEPYRDVVVTVGESDGFFAVVQVVAWFRPGREAPWEEREAQVECRRVGEGWQCDQWFDFQLTAGEVARRAQATATAVAQEAQQSIHLGWTNFTNANYVVDLLADGDWIWAATPGGVVRWDASTGEYIKLTVDNGLADNEVWAIAMDRAGALWFGTRNGVSQLSP